MRASLRLASMAVVLSLTMLSLALMPAAPARAATLADGISQVVRADPMPQLVRDLTAGERRLAQAVYAGSNGAPQWLPADPPYQANARALEVISQLNLAADKGLNPRDYPADWLRSRSARALPVEEAARFEATMTMAAIRYLTDLGLGRIDPARLGFELPTQRRREELGKAVVAVITGGGPFGRAAATVEPTLPLYPRLLDVLARYRQMAAQPALPRLVVPKGKVTPGDPYDGITALRAHLERQGDLVAPASRAAGDNSYDAETAQAVRRFQLRHGLEPDGVLGTATFEALRVPLARRVRQIELSLERLRWLGQTPDERFVAINLPEFQLWAMPGRDEGGAPLQMKVIVGATLTGTPVFVDSIDALEIHPYWNVPVSIAVKELVPKVAKDPGYLAHEDMELVGALPPGTSLHQGLESGKVRIRQKPGDKNALGRMKFVMPNRHSVYLHDTPSRQLFARSRRDFSHGCIRVEKPGELASFVLRGRSGFGPDRVQQALVAGKNQTVPLNKPVPVLIFYSTVNVGVDGQARFFRDLYQLDGKLDAALAAR